jgi:Zn-dependent M28 family amino/carboxypeptidase
LQAVLGANGGASGSATLLELARTLDVPLSGHTICLAFLDGEDNRGLPGWQEPFGGEFFVKALADISRCDSPRFTVMLDLVGGAEQRLPIQAEGDPTLNGALWQVAAELGYEEWFVTDVVPTQPGPHDAFVDADIPTTIIIDEAYAQRYTTQDTLDKLDIESLGRVGRTLEVWLESGAPIQGE